MKDEKLTPTCKSIQGNITKALNTCKSPWNRSFQRCIKTLWKWMVDRGFKTVRERWTILEAHKNLKKWRVDRGVLIGQLKQKLFRWWKLLKKKWKKKTCSLEDVLQERKNLRKEKNLRRRKGKEMRAAINRIDEEKY